jgi:hypothetical protein
MPITVPFGVTLMGMCRHTLFDNGSWCRSWEANHHNDDNFVCLLFVLIETRVLCLLRTM